MCWLVQCQEHQQVSFLQSRPKVHWLEKELKPNEHTGDIWDGREEVGDGESWDDEWGVANSFYNEGGKEI